MTTLALVGDIGGTNSRFGLVEPGSFDVKNVQAMKNDDFASLEAAISAYVQSSGVERVSAAAIAVAAPVDRDVITLTNREWTFSAQSLGQAARADRMRLLNDYEALALALPHLGADDIVKIVMGPGTGLGMAALVPLSGAKWLPVPCEPGHISLPVETQQEFDWREKMKVGDETFTSEDAVTGGGLHRLYKVIAPHGGLATPEDIMMAALGGADSDAARTLDQFIIWLARVCGDAVMTLQARGGLYLAGGIAPSIIGRLKRGPFRSIFEAKGKLAYVMKPIPVYVIIDRFPAFKGCAASLQSGNE
jgi:glucokinase